MYKYPRNAVKNVRNDDKRSIFLTNDNTTNRKKIRACGARNKQLFHHPHLTCFEFTAKRIGNFLNAKYPEKLRHVILDTYFRIYVNKFFFTSLFKHIRCYLAIIIKRFLKI